ncbi:MAG: ACP S-malonyltransferase, partial [Chromatiales bacterium]
GRDLYERHPEVRALFEEASETTAMNMTDLCFNGPDEVLKRTENAQPAVALVNAACLCVLKQQGITPHALAGHSLGEYTALYAARAMAFGPMMDLVRKRALFMQEAGGGAFEESRGAYGYPPQGERCVAQQVHGRSRWEDESSPRSR